jgi:hypothetical protein
MSHDINGELASLSVHAQPAVTRNVGQRQQWKLALEKAYLALEQSEREVANDPGRKAPFHGDEESGTTGADLQSESVDGLSPGHSQTVPKYCASSPGAADFPDHDFPDLSAVEGLEKAILTALQGEGNSQLLNMKGEAEKYVSKGLSAFERSGVAPKVFEMTVKENICHLYFEDGGVHLSLRHGGVLGVAQIGRIVSVVRTLLESQGLHLAKVTVNGVEQWKDREPRRQQSIVDNETRSNEIDRVY